MLFIEIVLELLFAYTYSAVGLDGAYNIQAVFRLGNFGSAKEEELLLDYLGFFVFNVVDTA